MSYRSSGCVQDLRGFKCVCVCVTVYSVVYGSMYTPFTADTMHGAVHICHHWQTHTLDLCTHTRSRTHTHLHLHIHKHTRTLLLCFASWNTNCSIASADFHSCQFFSRSSCTLHLCVFYSVPSYCSVPWKVVKSCIIHTNPSLLGYLRDGLRARPELLLMTCRTHSLMSFVLRHKALSFRPGK